MSLNPTHGIDVDAGSVIQGASGVEEGRCKEDEVEGGSHYDVQEYAGRDLDPVKKDDANSGRGLELSSEISQQLGDDSIFKGKSQAPKKLKSTTDFPAGLTLDGASSLSLPQQEKDARDETDMKSISTKDIPQQLVVVDSEDCSATLPEELVLIVFKLMKPEDILQASQTCQLWRLVGENDKLWEQKCKEGAIAYSLSTANLTALKHLNENSSITYSVWKENFLRPYKIARNFREGISQMLTVEMSGYDGYVEFCNDGYVEFCNDKIVTRADNRLYVFCALSGNLLHELFGATANVQINTQFVSASCYFSVFNTSDRSSVRVWNVATGSYLNTLLGHTSHVMCLKMHGTRAVSGSEDNALRLWDMQSGRCLRTLTGHTRGVYYVQFDGSLVVSGSADRTIKIWNAETGVCLRTLRYRSYITCVKFNGVNVVAGYRNGSIKVWEVDTGICRQTLEGNNRFSQLMELEGEMVVCTGADETTANIWNISTGACLHTLAGPKKHGGNITDIGVNDKLVVTSSRDGTVKLWDIKTGEFIRNLLVLESGGRVEKMRMEDAKIVCGVFSNERYKFLVLNFDTNSI